VTELVTFIKMGTITIKERKVILARNTLRFSLNHFIFSGSSPLGSFSPGAGGPTMSTTSPASGGIFLGMDWGGFSPYHLPPTGHKPLDSGELDTDLLRLKSSVSREQQSPSLPPLLTPE
jgi:hypothetical protein